MTLVKRLLACSQRTLIYHQYAADNHGYIYVVDQRHSCVYKIHYGLQTLIGKYGTYGGGTTQYHHLKDLYVGTAIEHPVQEEPYYVDAGEVLSVDQLSYDTGVRRALNGCDVLEHVVRYFPKPYEGGQDYLRLTWWQTGHAHTTINIYEPDGSLFHTSYLNVAQPGVHSDPWRLDFNPDSPDGEYTCTIHTQSIYGSTDTTYSGSLYVERYVEYDPIVVEQKNTFDPAGVLDWDGALTCMHASDQNKIWGAYVNSYVTATGQKPATICWDVPLGVPSGWNSPARIRPDTTQLDYSDHEVSYITQQDTVFFTLLPSMPDSWYGSIFIMRFSDQEFNPEWEKDDYTWLDTAWLSVYAFGDSCYALDCFECEFPDLGCPFLYMSVDNQWLMINNILSESECVEGDIVDYQQLRCNPSGSEIKLRIAETESEISHLDHFTLLAYDVPSVYKNVFFDGPDVMNVVKAIPVSTAVTSEGANVLDVVCQEDSQHFQSSGPGHLDPDLPKRPEVFRSGCRRSAMEETPLPQV